MRVFGRWERCKKRWAGRDGIHRSMYELPISFGIHHVIGRKVGLGEESKWQRCVYHGGRRVESDGVKIKVCAVCKRCKLAIERTPGTFMRFCFNHPKCKWAEYTGRIMNALNGYSTNQYAVELLCSLNRAGICRGVLYLFFFFFPSQCLQLDRGLVAFIPAQLLQ